MHLSASRPVATMLAALALCALPSAAQTRVSGEKRAEAMASAVLQHLRVAQDRQWHKGEYCHIVALANMIVAGDPQDLETYANAGWLLWSMDRDDEAEALYKLGIRNNPKSYYMYDELGQLYMNRKKDPKRAAEQLAKAVQMADCPPKTLHSLAHCYERVGDLEKSRDTWEMAASRQDNQTMPAARVNLERVKRLIAERQKRKQE